MINIFDFPLTIFRADPLNAALQQFPHAHIKMQQKLQKLFSFFKKIKNQPFYTSIISQIVQTYQTCPQSLKYILYNLNQLIFAPTQEVKLRIKHRLICASIVGKLCAIYALRVKRCLDGDGAKESSDKGDRGGIDLENFQLQADDDGDKDEKLDKQKDKEKEEPWEKMDIFAIIEKQDPLMSTKRQGTGETSQDPQKNENRIFQQYLNMNQATMINIQQLFKDVKNDKSTAQSAFQQQKSKYQKRIQKIKQKSQPLSSISLRISNPFNLLYQICIDNLLHPEWQLRHLATLLLKQLMYYPQFIGFSARVEISDHQQYSSREERFRVIEEQIKDRLREYRDGKGDTLGVRKRIWNQVTRGNLKILARDKFADYQSDQSNIIVRNKAAQTLARCYIGFTPQQQIQLLKKIKRIFDKQIKPESKSNFTWEVKHSFMVFINFINEYPEYQENIYKLLQQSMIKMLISEQQIDQIVYSICQCFKKFLNKKFFGKNEAQRVNEQVWKIVKNLDDISISTVSALQLLQALFPQFNLNICTSLLQIRKFFNSKIPQVRKQCYTLLKMLYEKPFSLPTQKQKKLLESNITQFLQASIFQHETPIFLTLLELSPPIFHQIRKQRKIFLVVQFITDVVLCQQYTQKLIESKFKIFDGFGLDKNDYLFIYEQEKSNIGIDKYLDKRMWKVAQVVAKGFEGCYENFGELINSIEIHSKNSDRGKLFILHLLVRLVGKYKSQALFNNYVKIASQLMKLDFSAVSDSQIQKYRAYSQKNLIELKSQSQKFTQRAHSIPTQSKNPKQLAAFHSFLCQEFNEASSSPEPYPPQIRQKIETQINILESLIQHQRLLFKQIKTLSTYLFVSLQGFTPETVNSIVSTIRQSLQQDRYSFISEYGAWTFTLLCEHLKSKKTTLGKIVTNTFQHVGQKYQRKELRMGEIEGGWNIGAGYMMGLRVYIEGVGGQWLKGFENIFVGDYGTEGREEGAQEENMIEKEKSPMLFLASGTIGSLLKICDVGFLERMLAKLEKIVEVQFSVNRKLLYELLTQSFTQLCEDYSQKSNIFYQWFLKMLKKGHYIILQVLTRLGEQNIFKISPVCCLFVLEIVKQVSQQKLKDLAMVCLSNIVVGVYMNNKTVNFGEKLQDIAEEGIQFVKNFRDASNFQYKNQVQLKSQIDLRQYQKEGIQWLGFLTKFNLNGALCDDMGLGKTLQIFVLLQNQYLRDIKQNKQILPSLIISPTTLTEHWAFEYKKYFAICLCQPLIISSKQSSFSSSLPSISKSAKPHLLITSYQTLQKRIELFQPQKYKFIILDQGHIIKNPKTNKFLAVKRLISEHRFILTGTPIQNRLKELWSLFDFLMPGYLYSKQVFKSHYQKLFQVNLTTFKEDQLLFTDEQKRILEKLHLKVMPFIMRRMKSQVLKELPQKIINDYYCQLTPVQLQLYKQFENQNHRITKGKNQQNILSSLSKMRKILNHPNLIGKQGNYQTSGKFLALNELFQQLGFRQEQQPQNKAILFSRSTSTIELLQKLFMQTLYPKLRYSKLTSGTKANQRFMVAQNFNGDNDIKVLLVTTAVGGEGLNLTSANTVIMFDHDYNPTVDMQAIDRAHRIGQKRVLNVYRLITRNTLEQRIMGIQKFKKNLAQAIVNIDNSSIKNIEQSKLPQLLQNMKDLQQRQKDKKQKIKKSFYNKLVQEMENDAIDIKDYDKQY